MPTGACGINCDVCQLRLMGVCSSCGSGCSDEAQKKLAAQRRLFGATCTILECAALNRVRYCLRDCGAFPCENFAAGPYPYGQGFLSMQQRRRSGLPPALDPNHRPIEVPEHYWKTLSERDPRALANFTLAESDAQGGIVFCFLNRPVRVDIRNRSFQERFEDGWRAADDPLLTIVTLIYFCRVDALYPLGKDLVSTQDLKEAHFFTGPHELNTGPLIERYAEDPDGFCRAAEYLGGRPEKMADRAFRLLPYPRIPLYFLYWNRDPEFGARISVLFDRSIERSLTASGIWGLVKRVSIDLLRGPTPSFAMKTGTAS